MTKFDSSRNCQNHIMRQQLRERSNMICELKAAGHILTDEQQVQEVIRSLPDSWLHMMVNMTHNESIRTFNDIEHHLELEVKRLEATKLFDRVYMTESNSHKASSFKYKRVIIITRRVRNLILIRGIQMLRSAQGVDALTRKMTNLR